MAKVSIGLRGWRFDVGDVFDDDGNFRPMDEMPADVRNRLSRLTAIVGSPCDACWLVHGDENLSACNVAEVVYGEPLGEVVLCAAHEPDFLYWFRERGGDEYRGSREFQDAFHEWFADGGRAPEDYDGLDHVDSDPEAVPTPDIPDSSVFDPPSDERARIDLRAIKRDEE